MLTSEKVEKIFKSCLFRNEEVVNGKSIVEPIIVEGLTSKFGFHPKRVEMHKKEIIECLDQLDDKFKSSGGGGWSFLNMCNDKNGNQWTGLHRVMENLVCIGIATGKVSYQFPRNLWVALPGGVPYIIYNDK